MLLKITVLGGLALLAAQANASKAGLNHTALSENALLEVNARSNHTALLESALLGTFGPYGGTGGDAFSDIKFRTRAITGIDLRSGSGIDSIRFLYAGSGAQPPPHGGSGGAFRNFNLNRGERITAVNIRSGSEIDAIQFVTSTGRLSLFYGGNGGGLKTVNFGRGGLKYISGRSGSRVDQLTFHT